MNKFEITNKQLLDTLANLHNEVMKYSDTNDVCSQDLNHAMDEAEALLMKARIIETKEITELCQ